MKTAPAPPKTPLPPIRFNRQEWAGAFGDLGTDLPLIVGMLLATNLNPANVLILFGAMQISTGLLYRLPMPVQPLKAVAAIVITQKTSAPLILGAGMAIGFVMFLLTLLGALKGLAHLVPKPVIRGIQAGLGLQLATIALKEFIGTGPAFNFVLAGTGALIVLALKNNRKLPASLLIVGAGIILTLVTLGRQGTTLLPALALPMPQPPTLNDIAVGFLLLGLPQLPLSLANSILATHQLIKDYFPERPLPINKIGFTYALMNLISSPLGGIPVCHGSGGMAGHYTFGARTGGSVIIYGSVFLLLGLFFSGAFAEIASAFPRPLLGVLLFFEGLALTLLIRDVAQESPKRDFPVSVLVALLCAGVPYGYVAGLLLGIALHYAIQKNWTSLEQ
jgi:MFS superfamily sulfate permease-like transporter